MIKIKCFICGDVHKARSDKFPMMLYNTTKKGEKVIDRKFKGYACKKCVRKGVALNHKKNNPEFHKTGWKDILKLLSMGKGRGVINVASENINI